MTRADMILIAANNAIKLRYGMKTSEIRQRLEEVGLLETDISGPTVRVRILSDKWTSRGRYYPQDEVTLPADEANSLIGSEEAEAI